MPQLYKYDVVVLTEKKYVSPIEKNEYIENLLLEDQLIMDALVELGLRVHRTNWDNNNFDWESSRVLLVRSTWDYSERIDEFLTWLEKVEKKCKFINPAKLLKWNIDKHYLGDLSKANVRIVPTVFVNRNKITSLTEILKKQGWNNVVIKPVISCAGRETHKILAIDVLNKESLFARLISEEAMMVQPFIESIETKGEISMMVFGGKYSHSVLKKAKKGDFRVQDDFGGTVHDYVANSLEIAFAENVVKACPIPPLYARVDIVWDKDSNLCLSELELIEPELWFRNREEAASDLALFILKHLTIV